MTLLFYDDFEGRPLPELRQRIKINLRSLFVQVFECSGGTDAQLLYFKERYISADHPRIEEMRRLSAEIGTLGIECATAFGPKKSEFNTLLSKSGMVLSGAGIKRIG